MFVIGEHVHCEVVEPQPILNRRRPQVKLGIAGTFTHNDAGAIAALGDSVVLNGIDLQILGPPPQLVDVASSLEAVQQSHVGSQ